MFSVGKMEALTRIGFAARGIMYLLIGYFALSAGRAEDGAGALRHLTSGAGKVLLCIMAVGFLAYGLWRLAEAKLDTENHGSAPTGLAARLGGAVSGLIHLGLAATAAGIALGGRGSGDGSAEDGAATVLALPGGKVALIAVAALLLVTGLFQLIKAVRADFLRHLGGPVARQAWVKVAGRAGYAARGIVFASMGIFLWRAARTSDASKAADMGQALASLPGEIQVLVAAGLGLFGLFSLVEARFRRINDPKVLERLSWKRQSA